MNSNIFKYKTFMNIWNLNRSNQLNHMYQASSLFRTGGCLSEKKWSYVGQQFLHRILESCWESVVTDNSSVIWSHVNTTDVWIGEELPFIDCDIRLKTGRLVEFFLALGCKLLDKRQVLFKTFDFNILFEHFNESLCDKLLQYISVDFRITDFLGESFFNFLLNSFDVLMPEFHFGHSGFVDFSTFHDLDVSL